MGQLGQLSMLAGGSPWFEIMQIDMSNSYYSLSTSANSSSIHGGSDEAFKAGIYPYKNGYKVYLYMFYKQHSKGVVGLIGNAALNSTTKDLPLKIVVQVRDKFLELVPSAKATKQQPSALKQY